MFLLEKLRIGLKCHRYDVTDIDVFIVFYLLYKNMDMETDSVMFKGHENV